MINSDSGKEPAFFTLKDMEHLVEVGVKLTYCKHIPFPRLVMNMNMTQEKL